jgi:hypothetical protein
MIFRNTEFTESCPRSPGEAVALDDARVATILDLADGSAAARVQAYEDFLGYQIVVPAVDSAGHPVRYLSRQTPMPYTALVTTANPLGDSYLYCTNIPRGEPLGKPAGIDGGFNDGPGVADYERYRLHAEFRTVPFDVHEDNEVIAATGPLQGFPDDGDAVKHGIYRYVTKEVRPAGRFLVLRNGLAQYSDGTKIPEGYPVKEVMGEVIYTWHHVPAAAVPWLAIQRALGCVNVGSFFGLFGNTDSFDGFPQGTLLFNGLDPVRRKGWSGDVVYTIKYFFSFLPRLQYQGASPTYMGWNSAARTTAGAFDWVPVQLDGIGTTPYRYIDFAILFRPDQPPP